MVNSTSKSKLKSKLKSKSKSKLKLKSKLIRGGDPGDIDPQYVKRYAGYNPDVEDGGRYWGDNGASETVQCNNDKAMSMCYTLPCIKNPEDGKTKLLNGFQDFKDFVGAIQEYNSNYMSDASKVDALNVDDASHSGGGWAEWSRALFGYNSFGCKKGQYIAVWCIKHPITIDTLAEDDIEEAKEKYNKVNEEWKKAMDDYVKKQPKDAKVVPKGEGASVDAATVEEEEEGDDARVNERNTEEDRAQALGTESETRGIAADADAARRGAEETEEPDADMEKKLKEVKKELNDIKKRISKYTETINNIIDNKYGIPPDKLKKSLNNINTNITGLTPKLNKFDEDFNDNIKEKAKIETITSVLVNLNILIGNLDKYKVLVGEDNAQRPEGEGIIAVANKIKEKLDTISRIDYPILREISMKSPESTESRVTMFPPTLTTGNTDEVNVSVVGGKKTTRSKKVSKRRTKRATKSRSKRATKSRSKKVSKRRSKKVSKRRSKKVSKRRSKRRSKKVSKRRSKKVSKRRSRTIKKKSIYDKLF